MRRDLWDAQIDNPSLSLKYFRNKCCIFKNLFIFTDIYFLNKQLFKKNNCSIYNVQYPLNFLAPLVKKYKTNQNHLSSKATIIKHENPCWDNYFYFVFIYFTKLSGAQFWHPCSQYFAKPLFVNRSVFIPLL